MDINWDYNNRKVHLSKLAYVTDTLTRFRHNQPRKPQHQPHPHINPTYGAKAQYAEDSDVSPTLTKEDKKCVQEVKDTFLYYEWSVYPTMLTALGSIAAQKANPTEQTMKKL